MGKAQVPVGSTCLPGEAGDQTFGNHWERGPAPQGKVLLILVSADLLCECWVQGQVEVGGSTTIHPSDAGVRLRGAGAPSF